MSTMISHTYRPAVEKVVPKDAVVLEGETSRTVGLLREAANLIARNVSGISGADSVTFLRMLAGDIEAQTRPPKPAEPTGLGAVVEDRDGARFVRTSARAISWLDADDTDAGYNYADLAAVRVLSSGVKS